MTAQVLFFDVFFEKDPHLNALEIYIYIHIHTYIRTHTHTHTHIYINIYISSFLLCSTFNNKSAQK